MSDPWILDGWYEKAWYVMATLLALKSITVGQYWPWQKPQP